MKQVSSLSKSFLEGGKFISLENFIDLPSIAETGLNHVIRISSLDTVEKEIFPWLFENKTKYCVCSSFVCFKCEVNPQLVEGL